MDALAAFCTKILVYAVAAVVLAGIAYLAARMRAADVNRRGVLSAADEAADYRGIQARIKAVAGEIVRLRGRLPMQITGSEVALLVALRYGDAARIIADRYLLPRDLVLETKFGRLNGYAGNIQRVGPRHYSVTIDQGHVHDEAARFGILAHELAHVWVDIAMGRAENGAHDERMVDVAAVLLGGGVLILQAMKQFSQVGPGEGNSFVVTTSTWKVGYLTLVEYAYVLAASLRSAGAAPGEISGRLPPVSRRAFQVAQRNMADFRLCWSITKTHVTGHCDVCFQKYRVPRVNNKEVDAFCPNCRRKFVVKASKFSGSFIIWDIIEGAIIRVADEKQQ